MNKWFKIITVSVSTLFYNCSSDLNQQEQVLPTANLDSIDQEIINTDYSITYSDSCQIIVDLLYDYCDSLYSIEEEDSMVEVYRKEGQFQYLPRNIPSEFVEYETILPGQFKIHQDGVKASLFPTLHFEFMNGALLISGDTVVMIQKFDNSHGSISSSFITKESQIMNSSRIYSDLGYIYITQNSIDDECEKAIIESFRLSSWELGEITINNLLHFELFFIDSNSDSIDEIYILTFTCLQQLDQIIRIKTVPNSN